MSGYDDYDYERAYERECEEEDYNDYQELDPEDAREVDILEKQESGYFGSEFDN
jgi:hypothetical protein